MEKVSSGQLAPGRDEAGQMSSDLKAGTHSEPSGSHVAAGSVLTLTPRKGLRSSVSACKGTELGLYLRSRLSKSGS